MLAVRDAYAASGSGHIGANSAANTKAPHLELPEAQLLPLSRQSCSILHQHLGGFPKQAQGQQHLQKST